MIMQQRLKVCDWPALCPWHLLALSSFGIHPMPCSPAARCAHNVCAGDRSARLAGGQVISAVIGCAIRLALGKVGRLQLSSRLVARMHTI